MSNARALPVRQYRYQLAGKLRLLSALHIGTVGGDLDSDAPVIRDGMGRLIIPGTSLAGAIRSQLTGGFASDAERDSHELLGQTLWGGSDDGDTASLVVVDDAVIVGDYAVEVRQGVSIERFHGVAADGNLFSRELIAEGATFDFSLAIEADEQTKDAALELACLIREVLGVSELAIGASTSSGTGRVRLDSATLRLRDFSSLEGITRAVLESGLGIAMGSEPSNDDASRLDVGRPRPGVLRISMLWRPLGPLLSSVRMVGGVVDTFPLTTSTAAGVRLIYPGTSIKGVFRSNAERAVRTLSMTPLPDQGGVLAQLKADFLDPIGDLFGLAGDKDGDGRSGVLAFHDALSSQVIPFDQWNEIRFRGGASSASKEEKNEALRAIARDVTELNRILAENYSDDSLWFDVAVRNAIDRWTGGAADSALYTSIEPYAASAKTWEPLVIDIDWALLMRRYSRDDLNDFRIPLAALALVLLMLRDVVEGWVNFGSGVTRGLGSVEIEAGNVRFQNGPLGDGTVDEALGLQRLDNKSLAEVWAADDGSDISRLLEDLETAWVKTMAVNHNNLNEHGAS